MMVGAALFTVVVGLALVALTPLTRWAFARLHWALALPSLPADAKLTRSLLLDAARRHPHLVRLPRRAGVLLTDAGLARRACEHADVAREVDAYARYAGFIDGALVLLHPDSAEHRGVRAALAPLFAPAHARSHRAEIAECADELVRALERDADRAADGAVDPLRPLQRFALQAASATFLGGKLATADAARLAALFGEFEAEPPPQAAALAGADAMGSAPDPPAECALRRRYDAMLDGLVARQQQQQPRAGRASVLSALLGAGLPCAEAAAEARKQSAGLLFAALNAANELRAVLRLVSADDAVQARAREEVDGVHVAGGDVAEAALGGALPYVGAVVNEALRLEPGILHFKLRATRTACLPLRGSLCGRRSVVVPRGTVLVVSPYLLHRHPAHWPVGAEARAQPELFDPSDAAGAVGASARAAGAFMPFGAGPKRCPAGHFALAELRLALASVLRRFELRCTPGARICLRRRTGPD